MGRRSTGLSEQLLLEELNGDRHLVAVRRTRPSRAGCAQRLAPSLRCPRRRRQPRHGVVLPFQHPGGEDAEPWSPSAHRPADARPRRANTVATYARLTDPTLRREFERYPKLVATAGANGKFRMAEMNCQVETNVPPIRHLIGWRRAVPEPLRAFGALVRSAETRLGRTPNGRSRVRARSAPRWYAGIREAHDRQAFG